MTHNHILFNTENYKDIDDEFLFYDDLEEAKHYISSISKAKNGKKLTRFVMLSKRSSHYGSIGNNGATGYRIIDSVSDMFHGSWDDLKLIYNDNENKYTFVYSDHDGTTYAEFAPITHLEYDSISELTDFNEIITKTKEYINRFNPPKLLDCWNTCDSPNIHYAFP